MSELADWLHQVPQMTQRAQEAREAYVRWLREQQQAAIDAYPVTLATDEDKAAAKRSAEISHA